MHDEQKPNEQKLADELVALERQLRGLTPASPHVDRDTMMFAAGHAAGVAGATIPSRVDVTTHIAGQRSGGRRFWPAATFTMTAATLLLATILVWQNRSQSVAQLAASPQPTVKLVGTPRSAEVNPVNRFTTRDMWTATPPASSGYLGVRYVALTRGAGDFPSEYESPNSDADFPAGSDTKPATARRLLDELLPAHSGSHQSRS